MVHCASTGYLEKHLWRGGGRVQLLAQALDSSGNVIDQKIAWVPVRCLPSNRVYYRDPQHATANRYRVTSLGVTSAESFF